LKISATVTENTDGYDKWHPKDQRFVRYCCFPDIQISYLLCIFKHLATLWTDLTNCYIIFCPTVPTTLPTPFLPHSNIQPLKPTKSQDIFLLLSCSVVHVNILLFSQLSESVLGAASRWNNS